ncbi:peptidoglycan/LPS O-acetylase OafA/YrhL [Frondihabitans australicus]|uniref:Peptidoglycan/LPS O-acetylase OafA/YrhL n=2 Tax=Frondihabitans australicus TaxID=386892 RepID=A0A495IC17_9MICO|nr:peptidoglycan/LPS O-acetylase OafA/YrhL [Frondihabitans australicus]
MARRGTLRTVQVLRALAAIMVVFAHLIGPDTLEGRLPGHVGFLDGLGRLGPAGVGLFFVISGVIMVLTTMDSGAGVVPARQFLLKRIVRIYPPYLVITAFLFAVSLVSPGAVDSSQAIRPDDVASFLLLPQLGFPLLLVGWTLVYEMYFYLVYTLAMLVKGRARGVVLVAWTAATFVLMELVPAGGNAYLNLARDPINLQFGLGALVGWLLATRKAVAPIVVASAGTLASVVVLVLAAESFPPISGGSSLGRSLLIGVPFAILVYGAVGLEERGLVRAPSVLSHLGDVSYSLYLTHVVVLGAIKRAVTGLDDQRLAVHLGLLVLALAAVVVVAEVFYRVVEKPLLSVLHHRLASALGRRMPPVLDERVPPAAA